MTTENPARQDVLALAHRIAWRYKMSSDPAHSDTYTFNESTLLQFVEALPSIPAPEGGHLAQALEEGMRAFAKVALEAELRTEATSAMVEALIQKATPESPLGRMRDALAVRPSPAEGDEHPAEQVCAQAYQVVGSLLSDLDQFGTELADKILDNLSEARIVHDDVLPWPSFAKPQPKRTQDADRADALQDRAYVAGAQAGFALGNAGDNDGLAKLIESRREALSVLRATQASAPAHELTPGEIQALWAPYAGAAPFAFARKIEAAITAKLAQVQR